MTAPLRRAPDGVANQMPTVSASSAAVRHFGYNAVGHAVALTDDAGAVTQGTLYEAFGGVVSQTGGSTNARLANTKERDATTGLDNHGFRYYDPAAGRYLTRDPLGYADGLNAYAHVGNNPVNRVDPLGLSAKSTQKKLTAARADLQETVNSTAKGMVEGGWRPANKKYPGSFGDSLEAEASANLSKKEGWHTNVHVDMKTRKIVAMGPDAPRKGTSAVVQVDAVYAAEGKLSVGDTLDSEASLVVDLKANRDGIVGEEQTARLNKIAGKEGALRVHSPYRWSAKEQRLVQTSSQPIKGLRALKGATMGAKAVAVGAGVYGIYAAVTDQHDESHLAKIGNAMDRFTTKERDGRTAEARSARMDAIDAVKGYLDAKTGDQWSIATSLGAYWAYLQTE